MTNARRQNYFDNCRKIEEPKNLVPFHTNLSTRPIHSAVNQKRSRLVHLGSRKRYLRYLAQLAVDEDTDGSNAIMTSLLVVCYVIISRYRRYFFRGSAMIALESLALAFCKLRERSERCVITYATNWIADRLW